MLDRPLHGAGVRCVRLQALLHANRKEVSPKAVIADGNVQIAIDGAHQIIVVERDLEDHRPDYVAVCRSSSCSRMDP